MFNKLIEIQNIFKKYKDLNIALEYGAPQMGEFLDIDRLVIFKRLFDEDEKKSYLGYNFEWVKEGYSLRYSNTETPRRIYIDEVFNSYGSFAADNFLYLDRKAINLLKDQTLKDFYKDPEIKSILILPIVVNNDLWGSLSLHELSTQRNLTKDGTLQRAQVLVNDLIMYLSQLDKIKIESIQSDHSFRMASLGKIAASIAHEINNPIFLIGGFSSKLEQILDDGYNEAQRDDAKKCLEYIQKNCKKTTNIIEGLRLMSRPSTHEDLEVSNICELIQRSLDLYKDKSLHEKIDLIFDHSDEEYLIECRPGQISQVLSNLLNNSFDAIGQHSGPKWIKICIGVINEDKQIMISISDSGKRPSVDIIKNMMEPFFTTKQAGKGTGLGLSISKEIVSRFHGSFSVDTLCENMKFDITFPLLNLDDDSRDNNE